MISNTKPLAGPNRSLIAITSPSASAVVHNTQSVPRPPQRIPNQSVNHQVRSQFLQNHSTLYYPDCGKACSVGTLNEACDTCVCESSTIQGRILSSAGYPVSFADIATDTAPLTIIAQSNSTGFFILNNTCISSTVIVTREGFQDKVVQITSADQIIYLELEGRHCVYHTHR